ncbi:dTDP-4-dehydrorhamnose 3,5-epimerase family protein [Rurimicrobium arvi]|uniref:dTDP-4-dehydrorhamnose 3,5-epimerase n=1 Tax=Rurimicrobium arvi TaxID=2049916 RepID=A0ABP8N0I1_9BACT
MQHKLLDMPCFSDNRGRFVKTFNDTAFQDQGINFRLKESYFSVSAKDVIRGMHFHLPPHDHDKVVFCPYGAILDVIVDLRSASPEYGKTYSQVLSAENNRAFFIPRGFAHGFKSLEEGSVTYYLVSGEYVASADEGIAFDSIGFDWACENPVLSDRDRNFLPFAAFRSPF